MSPVKPSVLIVGAGELGAATAVSLLQSGNYGAVTVIDRARVLPALDAASCDINKTIRFDYADDVYSTLGFRAIKEWQKPEWDGIYHQTGVVVRGLEGPGQIGQRVRNAIDNVVKLEPRIKLLNSPEDFTALLAPSPDIPVNSPAAHVRGYHNPTGGWAHASAAVEKLYQRIRELGGKIVPGAEMAELLYTSDGKDVRGVRCKDGREFTATKVVIALGSWTPSHPAHKGMIPEGLITATGQTIAAIQLSPEDAKRYAKIPISMHHDGSGFYMFPPNDQGIIKFALHRSGYTSSDGVPRTAADPQASTYTASNRVGWIPKDSFKDLRKQLGIVYPELAKMPVVLTRMCWYSDVVDGDWVFDYSPDYPSLMFATGGAGHAFKFLPIIGDLIRARMEGTLEPHLAKRWRVTRTPMSEDPARTGMKRRPLELKDLVTEDEMRGLPARL